jgi:diacylglycerol kinase family enzyme
LRMVLFRTRSRLAYLRYIIRGMVGARWKVGGIELQNALTVRSRVLTVPKNGVRPIFVEADGELLGMLPAEISVVPDALTLLVPEPTRF